jgi:hypothetical protein
MDKLDFDLDVYDGTLSATTKRYTYIISYYHKCFTLQIFDKKLEEYINLTTNTFPNIYCVLSFANSHAQIEESK